MIFVTVGTHEQQFNRLIAEIDKLKKREIIKEDVFIQKGYSDYIPTSCEYKNILTFKEMEYYLEKARIVITHGGPASFMKVLEKNKVPIVVPRKIEFLEHVNNHQSEFVNKLNAKAKRMIIIDEINKLEKNILEYDLVCNQIKSESKTNNTQFVNQFDKIVNELVEKLR